MRMDTYQTKVSICIEPIWHDDPPEIAVSIGDWQWSGQLTETRVFSHDCQLLPTKSTITVSLSNKRDKDTSKDNDKAIVIKSVEFNGISSEKLLWQGRYRPIYPEPWASQQRQQGQELQPELPAHTYLGWNGTWVLEFDVPVFTWIHRVENLGWIYD